MQTTKHRQTVGLRPNCSFTGKLKQAMLDLTSTDKEANLENCAINDNPRWRCWKIVKIALRRRQLWHFYHLDFSATALTLITSLFT